MSESAIRISVVVAVYNIERYLPKCLDSILGQDFKPYEVILVDDGSVDASGRICDQCASDHSFVKVVHRKNGGPSAARNTGINQASGEWLYFVDGDDLLAPNALSSFLEVMLSRDSEVDFVHGRMTWFADGTEVFLPDEVYIPNEWTMGCSGQQVLARCLKDRGCIRMGIRGLYRRSFLIENDLMFAEILFGEDQEWTPRLFAAARLLASNEEPCYLYREGREGSLVNTVNIEISKILFSVYQGWKTDLLDNVELNSSFRDELRKEALRRFVDTVCYFARHSRREEMGELCAHISLYKDLFDLAPGLNRKFDLLSFLVSNLGVSSTIRLLRFYLRIKG